MADKVLCDKSDLVNIADAVRSKLGVTDTYYVSELSSAIQNIQTGYEDGYAAGYKEAYNEMKLAVDMSDETYRFNEKVTSYPSNWYLMNLNFTDANGVAYNEIATFTSSSKINIRYTTVSGSYVAAYNAVNSPMWADEAYRTIHITDGAMTGDVKTCAWLIGNGEFNPKENL